MPFRFMGDLSPKANTSPLCPCFEYGDRMEVVNEKYCFVLRPLDFVGVGFGLNKAIFGFLRHTVLILVLT